MYSLREDIEGRITKVVKYLGEGMFGTVSLVEYDGKLACCKSTGDRELLGMFLSEAHYYKIVNGAGGCPRLYACAKDAPFLIMEYCRGTTLYELENSSISLTSWLKIYLSVARNLNQLHCIDLVHCDVHAENIMVETCQNGFYHTRLIDLGLCRGDGDYLQLDGEDDDGGRYVDPAYDVFKLGETMKDTFEYLVERSHFLYVADDVKNLYDSMCSGDVRSRPSLEEVQTKLVKIINDLGDEDEEPSGFQNDQESTEASSCNNETENAVEEETGVKEEAPTVFHQIKAFAHWIIPKAINAYSDMYWNPASRYYCSA